MDGIVRYNRISRGPSHYTTVTDNWQQGAQCAHRPRNITVRDQTVIKQTLYLQMIIRLQLSLLYTSIPKTIYNNILCKLYLDVTFSRARRK